MLLMGWAMGGERVAVQQAMQAIAPGRLPLVSHVKIVVLFKCSWHRSVPAICARLIYKAPKNK
jgi:hypothetical protein